MNQYKEFGLPETREANKCREHDLKLLKHIRDNKLHRKLDWGYHAFAIPPMDWAVIKIRFPDLVSKDAQIMNQAWAKFRADPISMPYRVQS